MSAQTEIPYADSTANFWSGCSKVSPGCANCYAETLARRFGKTFGQWGPNGPRRLHEGAFREVMRWRKKPWVCDKCGRAYGDKIPCCGGIGVAGPDQTWRRRRVFSLSMGDWLDPQVPVEWLARMLDTIRQCPELDFLLVTKRPELFFARLRETSPGPTPEYLGWIMEWLNGYPPRNVWIIASVENQEMADKRIPELLKIPAVVRGLSCEPLLGPIDLGLAGIVAKDISPRYLPTSEMLHWVIVGGESGKNFRPMEIEWLENLVGQCDVASVPVFVKQDSGPKPGQQGRIPEWAWNRKQFPEVGR